MSCDQNQKRGALRTPITWPLGAGVRGLFHHADKAEVLLPKLRTRSGLSPSTIDGPADASAETIDHASPAAFVFVAACRVARSFRFVHRRVGIAQDLLGAASLMWPYGDEADAGADTYIMRCS